MGYTHYWSVRRADPAFAAAWPTILDDTRRIIAAVRRHGIVVAGPDGLGRPTIDQHAGIALNGDATTDLDAEPFQLDPPLPAAPAGARLRFCKTNAKPYDLAVTAILLRCRLLLPDTVALRSDGDWDTHWRDGRAVYGGVTAWGARNLVAALFGPVPDTSPFSTAAWQD
jgi:hypothetical protein